MEASIKVAPVATYNIGTPLVQFIAEHAALALILLCEVNLGYRCIHACVYVCVYVCIYVHTLSA